MQNSKKSINLLILFFLLIISPSLAHSYIGPGLGVGTIGVVLGIIVANILILVAILWYPFKRLLKRLKKKDELNANKCLEENDN